MGSPVVQKRIVVPDIHVPFHDAKAVAGLVEFVVREKPHAIDILGDLCDCVVPDTRVLTYDLQWVPASSLKEGQEIVSFDAESPGVMADSRRNKQRELRKATVEKVGRIQRPRVRITVEGGDSITVSSGHLFLGWKTRKNRASLHWMTASGIERRFREGRPVLLHRPVLPWTEDRSYEGAFLRAAFDGEGCITFHKKANNFGHLVFFQNDNSFRREVIDALHGKGFKTSVFSKGSCSSVYVGGGMWEFARFIGSMRPTRFVQKWVDSAPLDGFALSAPRRAGVVNAEVIGEGEVIALKTSTGTLLTEGFSSHNCYPISDFCKDPERKHSLQDEFDVASSLLHEFRKAAPKAEIHLSEGNHESRLRRFLWGSGKHLGLRDLSIPKQLRLDDLNVRYHLPGEPYFAGPYSISHGHKVRKHAGKAARATADDIGAGCIVGHTHRMGYIPVTLWTGHQDAWEAGHLTDIRKSAEYIYGTPNWQEGWLVVHIGKGWSNVEPIRVFHRPGRHGSYYVYRDEEHKL